MNTIFINRCDAMKELNINAYRLADWFDQQSTNNK